MNSLMAGFASGSKESTIELVKRLRVETGVSLSQCKEAVKQTNGMGFNEALEWIKANTLQSASAKALKLGGRTASEGLVAISRNQKLNAAAMVELNCETDFVARNERFQNLAISIASSLLTLPPQATLFHDLDVNHVKQTKLPNGQTISEAIVESISSIGENIVLQRAVLGNQPKGLIGTGIHGGGAAIAPGATAGRIAALLSIKSTPSTSQSVTQALERLASQITKHIIGMNPATIEELLSQPYLFSSEITISQLLEEEGKKLSHLNNNKEVELAIDGWVRYACGENVQKKQQNFAEEAQQMLQK